MSIILNPSTGITTPGGSSTAPFPMAGVTNGSSAAAGYIGEVLTATAIFSAVSISSGAAKTLVSISLTAGEWDVSCQALLTPAAATSTTVLAASLSPTTDSYNSSAGMYFQSYTPATVAGANVQTLTLPVARLSLASTTTYYLVGYAVFTVSTLTGGGYITARRVR